MIFKKTNLENLLDRTAINSVYLADEKECVESLLRVITFTTEDQQAIFQKAKSLVSVVREKSRNIGGINAFMQQYDLSSQEGVVLLCLAEALLRIPDALTADQLIKDKLANADWDKYIGQSQSLFVNASTWGLMLTGKMVAIDRYAESDYSALLNNLVTRVSEPVVRGALKEAMRIMGHQFVMGRTIEEAIERSQKSENQKYRYSYDMLGEAALIAEDAEQYFEVYKNAIIVLANSKPAGVDLFSAPSVSVKLSALHPRFEFSKRPRLFKQLIPKVKELAAVARDNNIAMTIDGEEADRLDITLDVIEAITMDSEFHGWKGLGVVIQSYQKRAPYIIKWLSHLLDKTNQQMMVRLVKGAYWDTEIKRAQEQGLSGYPVFTKKQHTDISYLACAKKLLGLGEKIYPQFATHNAHTASALLRMVPEGRMFEFQRLHGMGEALHDEIFASGVNSGCRIYAPVGNHKDLLPYLVRRLLENGANTSFVNRITDDSVPVEEIVADPIQSVWESDRSPHRNIPLPIHIYGKERLNSQGINLFDISVLQQMQLKMMSMSRERWQAAPLINGEIKNFQPRPVVNPASNNEQIGEVSFAGPELIAEAIDIAAEGYNAWEKTHVNERAACLERAAQLLEQNTALLAMLIMQEGGRCLPDAISEIREAVDFCRYYAALACKLFSNATLLPGPTGESNELSLHGRGVFVCISPWNFPLAIFTGQIAAALVTGNTVIAKPASQTTLVAMQAINIMIKAGIPANALQFIPASGLLFGNVLSGDNRIAGVAFTGSTTTANEINIKLATRGGAIVPFIAETGGQNAMIVDSSALPEQVVQDVVKSAFNSAGQRCSALRVLFLQEEIAPRIKTLLIGAMAELKVGDPVYLSTDVGPVIDEKAVKMLEQHIEKMTTQGRLIYRVPDSADCEQGNFVTPCAFEIDALTQLPNEVFGPILHVITYSGEQLDEVLESINNTSYGLTLGIHSRIEEKARYIQQRVRVGNVYVNRNMIGASVGVQPFGGEGLSGTGPKAGGPHYLYRFATERVLTTNCAAIGGNASLLTLD